MSVVKRVLIVGGGIGGLTAAIALHRKGIQSEIVELNPKWSVYGVGIIQPSTCCGLSVASDLVTACLAEGRGFRGWQFCDSQGNKLAEIPSANVAGHDYPPTMASVVRPCTGSSPAPRCRKEQTSAWA